MYLKSIYFFFSNSFYATAADIFHVCAYSSTKNGIIFTTISYYPRIFIDVDQQCKFMLPTTSIKLWSGVIYIRNWI